MHHIFYDTETTGPTPRFDQILQAAAILTDEDFEEIDTIDERSRLNAHIVPTPGALKVTGVDPYDIARAPHSGYEFAHKIHLTFSEWSRNGASFDGWNTLRFDEEILRQMFWETLHDPYVTSGRRNRRNDWLTVVRALHARNPDVIDFPTDPDTGKKNFKLENLAPLNGFQGHDAHDALGDNRATIHMARLIRDVDPALFEHMLSMGNAGTATDFVDSQVVFQLLGGPMVNPGVLDVCMVATEPRNPKNKTAWNLAVDPTPYLDLAPGEILEKMKTSGTPFRSVKCNKQPAAFPMNWGFLHRVSTETYSPASPEEIDARAEMIRAHEGFQKATAEALALKAAEYDAPDTLEEKIYSGFPSYDDKARMRRFHDTPDWERRLDVVRSFEKPELRQLGLRTIFLNAPEVLGPDLRTQIDARLARDRFTLETDRPWNTVGKMMAELDRMDAETPGDPVLSNIRAWALDTYPVAREWTGTPPEKADSGTTQDVPEDSTSPRTAPVSGTPEEAADQPGTARTVRKAHYLDGLE